MRRERLRSPARPAAAAAAAGGAPRGCGVAPPRAAPTAGSTASTVGAPLPRAAERRGDDAAELLQVDRLGQVVVGAGLERLDRVLGRAVGGDDDRLLAPAGLLEPLQQVEAGAVGQAHVGDDGAVGAVLQVQQRFLDRAGGLDVVALAQQRQLVQRAQVGLVVDDEQAEVRGGGHGVEAQVAASVGCRRGRRRPHVDVEVVAVRLVAAAAAGSRCGPRSARRARGKYTGPGRCRGCASRRTARTGSARRRAGSARRRWRRCSRHAGRSSARPARSTIAPGLLAARGGARCRAG